VRPLLFYVVALVIVVGDQISKWAILQSVPYNGRVPVIGRFLYLTHTHNTGGAFSLFQAGNAVFIAVAVIAILALLYAYHRFQRGHLMVSGALSLALGGAIGNLIDRVRFGYVVDFFDIHAWTGRTIWPIFNVADSAITVGIVLLAWHFLFTKEHSHKQRPVGASDQSATTQASDPAVPEHPNT
jgi:signal peptidase II